MNKKHFQALAEFIAKNPALQSPAVVTALAQFCYEQNPRFDFEKWIAEVRHLQCLSAVRIIEYIDRENHNTLCIGTFESASDGTGNPLVNAVGRRFICNHWLDSETKLPIILTASGISGYHLKTKKDGSFAADICLVEIV